MNLTVVKIGGNVVDNPEALSAFLKDFAAIRGAKILIHGGGKEATRLSQALGIETTMIQGRRVTDAETIGVVTMVYAGLINKRIVSALQALGCDAIGLSGADASAITAKRRNPEPIDYGFVGDITPAGVNVPAIMSFLSQGLTPVFCAITHDGNGTLLNCNADSVAAAVAKAMATECKVELIYCFELDGVLSDINDPSSVVPLITPEERDTLVESGVIAGGMIPKIDNAIEAVKAGVASVVIRRASALLNAEAGTKIAKI